MGGRGSGPHKDMAQWSKVVILLKKGLTYDEIGARIGNVSRQRVQQMAKELKYRRYGPARAWKAPKWWVTARQSKKA